MQTYDIIVLGLNHKTAPVHIRERVNNTRWCVMRYPSAAFAMNARMPTNRFADFYYNACLLDYAELNERMKPLHELLAQGKELKLVGNGTDITVEELHEEVEAASEAPTERSGWSET